MLSFNSLAACQSSAMTSAETETETEMVVAEPLRETQRQVQAESRSAENDASNPAESAVAIEDAAATDPAPIEQLETADQAEAASQDEPLMPNAVPGEVEAFPRVFVHRELGHVDLLAYVLETRGMEYLELIACVAGTREHESLVAAPVRPSHLHAALLTIGLEPGRPHRYRRIDNEFISEPAEGPIVAVSVIVPSATGPDSQVPIHEWIANRLSLDEIDTFRALEHEAAAANLPAPPYPEGDAIEPLTFLFTGSVFQDFDGMQRYAADSGGTLVSLLNFGDDVIAARSDFTNRDGNEPFEARHSAMPEPGTWVRLRIRAVTAAESESEAELETEAQAPSTEAHPDHGE